jgi:hypothetical protein
LATVEGDRARSVHARPSRPSPRSRQGVRSLPK